ncbi:hypothetical protein OROGR_025289 [Orobanche gracilis]
MVMEVVHEDIGEDYMQCVNHPYRNSTPSPGGICVFCLQEKLGKLVSSSSSSYPSSVFPSSSSSSPPFFRSAVNGGGATLQPRHLVSSTKAVRFPFVLTHKKTKKQEKIEDGVMEMDGSDSTTGIVLKRSKSTETTSRKRGNNNINNNVHFLDEIHSEDSYSPSKRGFWSFLHLPKHSTPKKSDGHFKDLNFYTDTPSADITATVGSSTRADDHLVAVDECHRTLPFESKVLRSRSIGCGSRRFSGDFFEKISTGFGDCTLRRVESQREGGSNNRSKVQPPQPVQRNIGNDCNNKNNEGQDCHKEIVKCGGIFSSFMMASVESRSWVWAFASPMRAFGKPLNGKRDDNNNKSNNNNNNNSSNKNEATNLEAIPSLLAVRG